MRIKIYKKYDPFVKSGNFSYALWQSYKHESWSIWISSSHDRGEHSTYMHGRTVLGSVTSAHFYYSSLSSLLLLFLYALSVICFICMCFFFHYTVIFLLIFFCEDKRKCQRVFRVTIFEALPALVRRRFISKPIKIHKHPHDSLEIFYFSVDTYKIHFSCWELISNVVVRS